MNMQQHAELPCRGNKGRRLLDHVLESLGRVNLWVNNAGVAPAARLDLLETTPESWDRVLSINLKRGDCSIILGRFCGPLNVN